MKSVKLIIIVLLLSLIAANYGTEPAPPPYTRYYVSGTIVCDSLKDKSNYTVQLYGSSKNFGNGYMTIPNIITDYEHKIDLTDSTGNYFLVVNSQIFFDSVKIGIVQPHYSVIFSEPYFIDESKRIEVKENYSGNNTSGCNSCSSNPTSSGTRVVRYEYYLNDTSVKFCN